MQTSSADKKVYAGTHRACAPFETLANVTPLLSKYGITRVANITGLDHVGIAVAMAVRPNSRSLSVSQGKGLDLPAAKASAVMESIESHCAEHCDLPLRWATTEDLVREHQVMDPLMLPRTTRAISHDTRILWTPARELGSDSEVWVPFELVHLDLTLPLPPGSGFFPLGSNGLASGNTLPEALVHAVLELVERDAIALLFQLPADAQWERRVKLNTIDDVGCRILLTHFAAAGLRVGVWDATTDLGIPAFLCSVVEAALDPFRRIGKAYGYGCHVDKRVALCRALTEAAQSRLTRIAGSRDDLQRGHFDAIRASDAIERHLAEVAEPDTPPVSFESIASHVHASFEEDLRFIQTRLHASGLAGIAYVELCRDDVPFAVVRAVIPGLEGAPDMPGYVPGSRVKAMLERWAES